MDIDHFYTKDARAVRAGLVNVLEDRQDPDNEAALMRARNRDNPRSCDGIRKPVALTQSGVSFLLLGPDSNSPSFSTSIPESHY